MPVSIDRIVELSETVKVDEETTGYTGYGIAKVINDTFKALGSDVTVTPQHVYNDATNGKVNGVKGAKRFTDDEVETYVAKFVASRVRNTTNTVAELDENEKTGWDEDEPTESELAEIADETEK
jgi:hypothetical protein